MEKIIKRTVTSGECILAARRMATFITDICECGSVKLDSVKLFGVPRGGIPVVYLLLRENPERFLIVDDMNDADIIVDDVIGTGTTKDRYDAMGDAANPFGAAPFITLGEYLSPPKRTAAVEWITFPWEVTDGGHDESATDIVTRLLDYIGEDTKREGLRETPQRVLKAWSEWTEGYSQDPNLVLKVFEDGAESYDEMVIVKELPFYSHCEHHLAPFFGTATIAYIPDGKVVGLSKLGRILNIFSKRLQVQERLTSQVAQAVVDGLHPRGCGVLIKARHLCMESRGLNCQGHHTITSALKGNFLTDPTVRSEFLTIAK